MRISILLFIFFLVGCGTKGQQEEVIKDVSNWDRFLIPLAKPYEISNNQQEKNTWLLNMYDKRKNYQFSITPVEKVCVVDKYILIEGGGIYGQTSYYGNSVDKVFFVIEPISKTEVGFKDSLKFNTYIDSLKIKNIKWCEVNNLYKYYQKNRKLIWDN